MSTDYNQKSIDIISETEAIKKLKWLMSKILLRKTKTN